MDRAPEGCELQLTLIIGHRGAAGVEVENSLASFRRAVGMGTDGIELDVHATADGALTVMHDERIEGRRVGELTLAEVRSKPLANGEPVPTLAEALAAIGGATTVFVEVKTLPPSRDPLLLAALASGPAPDRYRVHSFDHRIIKRLQPQAPRRTYGVLSCSYPVNPLDALHDARATELWQHDSMIDAELVETVHRARCTVHGWTVDDPSRIRALRDMGVDGICTNRPDVARAALA